MIKLVTVLILNKLTRILYVLKSTSLFAVVIKKPIQTTVKQKKMALKNTKLESVSINNFINFKLNFDVKL